MVANENSNFIGDAGNAFGIYGGIERGGVTGDTGAAINATKLAAGSGLFGGNSGVLNQAAGAGSNLLGVYSGLQKGGAQGDATAAVNATQLGARLGAFGGASGQIGQYAGYAAIPLAVANFVESYQSGKTGSDTLSGAEAGATIGSAIPVVGTAIGAVVGGAVGALSSAFGPGAKDPETNVSNSIINATSARGNSSQVAQSVQNPYLALAGLMDERQSTLPMYAKYGRMGEQKFTNDMVSQINQAAQQGIISQSSTPQEVYNQVVAPWVASMGSGWNNVGATYTATTQGLLQDMVTQYMSGTAAQNWKAVGGDSPFSQLPAFGSLGFGKVTAPAQSNKTTTQSGAASTAPTGVPSAEDNALSAIVGAGLGMALGSGSTGMSGSTAVQVDPNAAAAGGATGGAGGAAAGSGGTALSSLASLFSGGGGLSGITGALPYLGAGAAGLYQAGQANQQNTQATNQLSSLGAPYTQAGQTQLTNFQNNTLTPQESTVVNTLNTQGQQLIDSAAPLAGIANTAFQNYAAGQLNPSQQEQINAWTATAKQTLRQNLASSGITDSSVLASQDAAIDSQATQLKDNLMTSNLQLGDQQYSQWLTSTQAGQQLQAQGAQYAVTSINTMLSQALQLGGLGTSVQADAIKLALQNDQQLSQSTQNLFKSLATAYAASNRPAGAPSSLSGAAGQAANALGGSSGLYASGTAAAARLAGGNAGIAAGGNTPGEPGNIQAQTPGQLQTPDMSSIDSGLTSNFVDTGYGLNGDNTVDTSTFNNMFYDPGSTDIPDINFGD